MNGRGPSRRAVLGLGLLSLSAGCSAPREVSQMAPAPVTPVGYDTSRALMPPDTQDLRISQISVRLADDFNRTAPHNSVTNAEIFQTLRQRIETGLLAANPAGQVPVRAEVEILRFNFAHVGVGLVTGFKGSFAEFRTTLFYVDSGLQVGRAATNRASTLPRPTLLGVLAIRVPEEELLLVAGAAPEAIATRLFGR